MFGGPRGLTLYFALIAFAFVSILALGDHVARHATSLAWSGNDAIATSRVTIGLKAQERSKLWEPVSYTSIVPNTDPQISVAELARSLDEAESQSSARVPPSTHIILVRPHPTTHVTKKRARTPRRLASRTFAPRKHPANSLTTAQIILRSLTSDL